MRKTIMILCLIVLSVSVASAQGFDMDAFLRLTLDKASQPNTEDAILTSRIGISVAYDMEIIPMISPGLEVQLGFFPLGSMLKEKVILFDLSGRLFNGMRLGMIELQPFGGYTLQLASANGVSYKSGRVEAGLAMIIGVVGLECAYIFPGQAITIPGFGSVINDMNVSGAGGAFRLGASWHLRSRNAQ